MTDDKHVHDLMNMKMVESDENERQHEQVVIRKKSRSRSGSRSRNTSRSKSRSKSKEHNPCDGQGDCCQTAANSIDSLPTCGYLQSIDDTTGIIYTESQRICVPCLLYLVETKKTSPVSNRRIVSYVFDIPNQCDIGISPHTDAKTSNGANVGKKPQITRESMVAILLESIPIALRAKEEHELEKLTTKHLCTRVQAEISRNYYTLRNSITEWASGVAGALSDKDLFDVLDRLGISVHDKDLFDEQNRINVTTKMTAADKHRLSLQMLLRIKGLEPKGFKKWSLYFSQIASNVGDFLGQHKGKLALVALTAISILLWQNRNMLPSTESLPGFKDMLEYASNAQSAGSMFSSAVGSKEKTTPEEEQPKKSRSRSRSRSRSGSRAKDNNDAQHDDGHVLKRHESRSRSRSRSVSRENASHTRSGPRSRSYSRSRNE